MSDIVVKRVGDFWAAVNNSIVVAEALAATQVIGKAVALAAEAARHGKPTRVIREHSNIDRQVIWDSEKDGFSAE